MLLDAKQMKQKKKSGEIGPIVQHAKGGGTLVHYVGEELQPRASGGFEQPVNLIAEFQKRTALTTPVRPFPWPTRMWWPPLLTTSSSRGPRSMPAGSW